MRLSLIIVLAAAVSLSGCISNMGEFKQFLGVTKAPPPALPPLAKAAASATSALVGTPVTFTSEGTRDPLALPLSYVWAFGDGASATGPTATHAYPKAGDYVARLVVTNARGAADEATVTLQVVASNRAPVAAISFAPARALAGEAILFDASASSDPDGGVLAYAWDFGDGATSHDAKPSHAFDAPGLHVVKLAVTDANGATSTATASAPVDAKWTHSGAFDVADDAGKAIVPTPVAGALASFKATLSYESGLANDLDLVLKDASGEEIARAAAPAAMPSLAGGTSVATIELDAAALAHAAPGAWTLEVVKDQAPAGVAWSLVVEAFA